MKWSVAAVVAGLAWAMQSANGAESVSGLDPEIARQVEAYQPMWLPPENGLAKVVVRIEPAGGNASDADQRRQDDLCLWAGSHLYHLVRMASGTPILARPDDRQTVEPRHDRADFIVSIQGQAKAAELSWAVEGNQVAVQVPTKKAEAIGGVPAHRLWAEAIYKALVKLAADRKMVAGEAVQPPPVPFYPKPAPNSTFTKPASLIWPEGNLPAERAPWFCNLFIKQTFSDRTNVYFEPEVTVKGDAIVIGGATNHPVLLGTLAEALKCVGLTNVKTDMRLLPENGRLDSDRWFGACVAPMALTFGKPSEGGPLETQLLYGEPVYLLDRADGFYLVQGGDGYVGWVREGCIRPMGRAEFTSYLGAKQAVLRDDVVADGRRMVRGARLAVAAADDASITVLLPEGGRASVPAVKARLVDDDADGLSRAKAGLRLLETPYLFGGRSSVGLDCSGLTGIVCDGFGTVLPRDAAQQFVTGRLVATRWFREALRPGDRFCFLGDAGKIFHTGICLGGQYFVHSSPPAVQISTLQPGERLNQEHWGAHFVGARRP
jgi:hypothetical protein